MSSWLASSRSFPFVERSFHNLRCHGPTAHINLDFLSFIGELDRNVCETDILLQEWCGTSGGNFAGFLAVYQHDLIVASNAAVSHFKRCKPPAYSDLFLPRQRFATFKVTLVQFTNPAEICFEQRRRLVDLVSVKRHAGFQPECVARRQPTRQDSFR